jgi:hypothetical protein
MMAMSYGMATPPAAPPCERVQVITFTFWNS